VFVLKLGYKASAEQFGPNELLAFSSLAETLGFDSVFVSDHFQPWKHTGGHAPFSLAWLGALGARARRILIGTSVITPTFRYHPAVVAQAMGTLGVLFPERVILGVGTGESLNEVPAVGIKWPGFKERQSRLRESILLMRRLWTEERVSFDGTFYRTEKATIYDRPSRPVPIYVAASGPSAATLAGELADGFICTSGKGMELYRDTLLPAVATGLRVSGRDEASIDRMIELKVSFGKDLQQCREETRHWAALALSSEEKTGVTDPLELERLAAALPLERAASRWIISTDPDEHVEKIGAYVALGFRHLVFHAPGPDQEGFLRVYAKEILSRLRRRFD
jgi:coenzyme F420-dependent glucose-6-phosphate dehydrogenase